MTPPPPLAIGERVTHALIWEAMAAKPGNVHRGADFEDMTFADMTAAAVAIGGAIGGGIDNAAQPNPEASLGALVVRSVEAMRRAVGQNTHLGTILLIAPLAIAARRGGKLTDEAAAVVAAATDEDTRLVYEAIRVAKPGGLGRVDQGDVAEPPSVSLLEAMGLAAGRDLVARQYTNGFAEVFQTADCLEELLRGTASRTLQQAILLAYLKLLSREPDSLIARKCGVEVAEEISRRAASVLGLGKSKTADEDELFLRRVADFDFWLRADGHRRNPGTTADILGAALFVLLAEDRLSWPVRFYDP